MLCDAVQVATFDMVEDFWGIFNNIRPPSRLNPGSNYHLFKVGIEPTWEHQANMAGGSMPPGRTPNDPRLAAEPEDGRDGALDSNGIPQPERAGAYVSTLLPRAAVVALTGGKCGQSAG